MLRNIGIRARSLICFGFLALNVLMLGLCALHKAGDMRKAGVAIDEDSLPAIMALSHIAEDFHRIRAITFRILITHHAQDRSRVLAMADDLEKDIKEFEKTVDSTEESGLYSEFKTAFLNYDRAHSRVLELDASGGYQEALSIATGDMDKHGRVATEALKKLTDLNHRDADALMLASKNAYDETLLCISVAILISVIATLILAQAFSKSIVSPLGRAVAAAEAIADKNLIQLITVDGKDEVGRLLVALCKMQSNLREAIQHISQSSGQLASASEELSTVTQESTLILNRQNDEMAQAATAVEQMSTAVEGVATNAVETSEATKDADKLSTVGRDQVQKVIQTLVDLTDEVTLAVSKVGALSDNVQKISKILDVIQSIAEQTNLLALNAAIEAARAGDAGRGFAVVADEVRGLAHRTQESTQEIEQMIGEIQQGTHQTVQAMQGNHAKSQLALDVARASGEALNQIAEAISRINERNLLIASATEEQAQVAREVDRNLINIRDLSAQTSVGASQTNAASRELAELAVRLNGLVTRFAI